MTIDQMHIDFKLEYDKTSNLENPAFEPEEIDLWLNKAIRKFVKTRYSGINVKRESFEQTQKRIDDLRSLIKQETLDCVADTYKDNCFIADLNDLTYDYWFVIGEEVLIAFLSLLDTADVVLTGSLVSGNVYLVVGTSSVTHATVEYDPGDYFIASTTTYTGSGSVIELSTKLQGVLSITSDTYRSHIDNPYSEHILHYEEAKPLRLFVEDTVELITDGSYGVMKYYIRYLTAPDEVSSESGSQIDCNLPEHTHDEIVKIAVSMALENVEQPRYQSHMNEIITME